MLTDYGYIGLFLAVAILFAVSTILIPFFLSLPARLIILLPRLRTYLFTKRPLLYTLVFSFLPSFQARFIPKSLQIVPYNPSPTKGSAYECGMETIGKTWVQFNFRYYFYALLFIALDILVVFLYPWAIGLRQLGYLGFLVILVFIFIIFIGYIHAWRKKVLEWK